MTNKEKMLAGDYYISLDCGKVTIGDNVWIGGGVTILGGEK